MTKLEPASVSVIVCVYNDAKFINNCLQSLKHQTYPQHLYEIIVVDDGSDDNTAEIVKQNADIRYFYQANQGPSVARNKGILASNADIVAFTDSDCEAAPNWIEALVMAHATFKNDNVVGVGGKQVGHPDDSGFAVKVDAYLRTIGFVGDYIKPHQRSILVGHNASCNASYRRLPLISCGGFRPHMFPGEDVELDKRLTNKGLKIRFIPTAIVFHHRITSHQQWCKMLKNYARAQAENIMIHGFFRLIHVCPFLGLLLFVLALLTICIWQALLPIICIFITCTLIALLILKRNSKLNVGTTLYFLSTTTTIYFFQFFKTLFKNYKNENFSPTSQLDTLKSGDRDDFISKQSSQ